MFAAIVPVSSLLPSCGKSSPKNDVGAPVTAVAAQPVSTAAPQNPTAASTTTAIPAAVGEPGATEGVSTAKPAEPNPATINPAATSTPTAPEPASVAQFVITVGTDSGPQRRQDAALGSLVTISVTNPNAADEFHLHGYDLELKAGKGEATTFSFTATQPGTFELESHATGGVLFVLRVA
jgi:hypothetical protein